MPFCCQCGVEVGGTDVFCAKCGSKQASAEKAASGPFANLSSRNASLLCYVPLLGWIPAIVVLASRKFKQDRDVRFHAFQGLYLFVAWLIVDWALGPFFGHMSGEVLRISIGAILKATVFCTWIFMIVKTSQDETFRLPVLGELAERSIAEQR